MQAYVETGGINYFQRRWEEIYVKLVNSDYTSNSKSGGCEIEANIEKGDSPKYTATIKAEHGPWIECLGTTQAACYGIWSMNGYLSPNCDPRCPTVPIAAVTICIFCYPACYLSICIF